MVTRADHTAATATGDTTETSIGTVTIARAPGVIVGLCCYAVGAATLTTGEAVTGVFRLNTGTFDIVPSKYFLDCVTILTSGAVAFNPRIYNVAIPYSAGSQGGTVEFFVTMDVAQTGALKGRGLLIFDL